MAPNPKPHEIIEISDGDDEPPTSSTQARSRSPQTHASRTKSFPVPVRRDPKAANSSSMQRAREDFVEVTNLSFPRKSSQNATNRASLSSKPLASPNLASSQKFTSSSQDAANRRSRDDNVGSSTPSQSMNRKRPTETITLSESDDETPARPLPTTFVTPRGLDMDSSTRSTDKERNRLSPLDGHRKRGLQGENPLDEARPRKKTKQDQREPGSKSSSQTQNASGDGSKARTEASTSSQRRSPSKATRSRSHEPVDLAASLGGRKQRPASNGENDESKARSPATTASSQSRSASGGRNTPVRQSQQTQEQPLANGLNRLSGSPGRSQQSRRGLASPKPKPAARSPSTRQVSSTETHGEVPRESRMVTRSSPKRTANSQTQPLRNLSPANRQDGDRLARSPRKTSPRKKTGVEMAAQESSNPNTRELEEDGGTTVTSFQKIRPDKPKSPSRRAATPPQLQRSTRAKDGGAKASMEGAEDADRETSSAPDEEREKAITEADLQLRSEAMQVAAMDEAIAESESVFALPTTAASALRTSSMLSGLPLANRVEKVLGKYLEELRGDNEYWTGVALKRARLTKEDDPNTALSDGPREQQEGPTSFANLKPLKFSPHQKGSPSTMSNQTWAIQNMATNGKPSGIATFTAPFTNFTTNAQDVPGYAHYIPIKNNILAPNITHLHCWPYFGEDFEGDAINLNDHYHMDMQDRERKLTRLMEAQKYEEYAESALHDLGCSWSDVLRFLLEEDPNVGTDSDAKKALDKRSQYCNEDFNRDAGRWVAVLDTLPPSTPEKLGHVAVLCENFQKMAKFSLWHVARRSEFATLPGESDAQEKAQPLDGKLTCRICLRFNCPYHGQFKHHADGSESDSDEEPESDVDSVVAKDIVHPMNANHRSRIAFPPTPPDESSLNDEPQVRKDQKDPRYWNGYRYKADERGPFYPCHHPGTTCEEAECSCFQKKIPCEKLCICTLDCVRKFKGCSCAVGKLKKGQKTVCFEDENCACWQSSRECDPDLCGACGVCDVVDPLNKYDEGILTGRCRNANIQRGVPKHTLLGDSGIHGLGLYACETIKQNEFVGEYKGEIITKKEADRRGAVYEHQKLSYLFSLNKVQEIDSTYFGNKVRFVNHAHGSKANLYPRIIMVNTVFRIALFAERHIDAGQELLFDYGPKFPDEQLQGKKSKKSAPHVRNANLVQEFLDVEESEDEVGNRRAKGVKPSAATKSKARSKPRGGARAGAGRKPHGKTLPTSSSDGLGKDPSQDAGERLAAFNISDDFHSDVMDLDAEESGEEDEAFEPDASGSEESDGSDESERSEFDDEDEDEDDVRGGSYRLGLSQRRLGRR